MLSVTSSLSGFVRLLRLTGLGLVLLVTLSTAAGAGSDSPTPPTKPSTSARATRATYEVTAGLDGEIYPAFANFASMRKPHERKWGTIIVKMTNSNTDVLRNRITVQVPGWSDAEIQVAELGAGESKTFLFAPTFLPRTYQNREIAGATASVNVTDASGNVVYVETVPVRLRSADDLYWGRNFEYAPFIASWVTPHDAAVERLLGRAKEFMPGRRLPGYESANIAVQERSTYIQARAIYRALQEKGISYVKSSMTLGSHEDISERVRMPAESLDHTGANCIDGAVMYAAMFENLGMQPSIVLVPGHAYVGVRVAQGASRYLYIETSLTGRTSFEGAVQAATRSLAKFPAAQRITVDIRQARLDGIFPMPALNSDVHNPVLDARRATGHPGS